MKKVLQKIIGICVAVMLATEASALKLLDDGTMDQYTDQSQGAYQPMDLSYTGMGGSLGMIQSAWQDPLQNLGEGQSKPAYSKYYWTPDLVLPIRMRESMFTVVNFPEWELIEDLQFGDRGAFEGVRYSPNTILLKPKTIGVDSNLIVLGRSGNKYVFYVKSEGFNTERLTNSIIDIDVIGDAGTSGGSPRSSSAVLGSSTGSSGNVYNNANPAYTRRFLREDWIKSIPLDPSKFRFDIEIYVPNPDDVIIAPERVWRDDIFTYIDLGEKALNMVQRPIVTLIVERSETPVGFRTKGPNNRLIIVEGIGDMVMRSGKRMVCLKLRRSDDEGTQYVSYYENGDDWDVGPKIPSGKQGKSGSGSSSAGTGKGNSGYGVPDEKGGINLGSGRGFMEESNNHLAAPENSQNNSSVAQNCSGVPCEAMGAGKVVMPDGNVVQNPYAQYKYGTALSGGEDEKLSIELGTDGNVNNLEKLWKDLSAKYPSVLKNYEPFYSVDTPADGQGKELFHLRVGPVKNLENGDAVCSQLGRNGVFCSVIRVQ